MILERKFIVFTKWIAFPILWAKDPSEIRVIGEMDADQIIRFTLVPITNGPNVCNRWDFWKLTGDSVLPSR